MPCYDASDGPQFDACSGHTYEILLADCGILIKLWHLLSWLCLLLSLVLLDGLSRQGHFPGSLPKKLFTWHGISAMDQARLHPDGRSFPSSCRQDRNSMKSVLGTRIGNTYW